MYSYGPPHMAVQKQVDQHEHTFSSYVRIQDGVLKTCLGRWTIGRSGERGSGYPCYQRDMMMMMMIYFRVILTTTWPLDSILQDLRRDFVDHWAMHCLFAFIGDFVLDVEGTVSNFAEGRLNVFLGISLFTSMFILIFPDWPMRARGFYTSWFGFLGDMFFSPFLTDFRWADWRLM